MKNPIPKKYHWIWLLTTFGAIFYFLTRYIHKHNAATGDTVGTFDSGLMVSPLFAAFLIFCAVCVSLWLLQLYRTSVARFLLNDGFGNEFDKLQSPWQKIVVATYWFSLVFVAFVYLMGKLI